MGDSGAENEYSNLTLSVTFVQAEASSSQDSGDDPVIADDSNVLTYPLSGTLDNGITYTLTSDGRAVIGGNSTIYLDEHYSKSNIAILVSEDVGDDSIYSILKKEITYQEIYDSVYNEYETDEECMADTGMTRTEYVKDRIGPFVNIVPVTTLEFAEGVTVISEGSFDPSTLAGFKSATTVILPSTITSAPNFTVNENNEAINVIHN